MLGSDRQASETDLRLGLVECARICYDRRLMTSNDGNLSVRLDDNRFLITPAGISKGRLHPDQLLVINLDGRVTRKPGGRLPSSETPMHLEVYKHRSDVRAVIHAHPVFATALTVAGMDFPRDVLPETLLLLGEVPVTVYASPGSSEDADAIRPFVQGHRAILLRQHGALTFGGDLEEALVNMERVEHVAEVFWRAYALGHVEHLPPDARRRLETVRARLSQE